MSADAKLTAAPSPAVGAEPGPFGLLGVAGGPGPAFAATLRELAIAECELSDMAATPPPDIDKLSRAALHLGRAQAFREAAEMLEHMTVAESKPKECV